MGDSRLQRVTRCGTARDRRRWPIGGQLRDPFWRSKVGRDRSRGDSRGQRQPTTFGRLDSSQKRGLNGSSASRRAVRANARDQIETKCSGHYGHQAALPYLGAASGTSFSVVDRGIRRSPRRIYHASKWALEGFSQALARNSAIWCARDADQPAGFDTDWAGSSSRRAEELPAYADGPRDRAVSQAAMVCAG